MKGTFFQKPLEFRLEVDGESWSQGQPVRGTLVVRNHGSASQPLAGARVELATGRIKKVHEKTEGAFGVLASSAMDASAPLEPGKEASFAWTFETDRNAPITDTVSSPFVLYGNGDSSEKLGHLQLSFRPEETILEVLKIFEIGFHFVVKGAKSSKGYVDVKLAPPASKTFAAIEGLTVSFRFEGDQLEAEYVFQVKKMEAAAAALEVKKGKKEFRQSFSRPQYRMASGRFNHEEVEKAVREILEQRLPE